MDDQQVRILDDLRDIVSGDILVDDLSRAAYSSDASILQVRPMAIVAPRTVEELAAVVEYASEAGVRIHPRGAGTGLAGESLGPDLMVDTARYLNRIVQTGRNTVRVEPGVRLSDLQAHLAPQGRRFGPDPVSGDRCTIGGMLATDAAGPHSLRYGTTRDHVVRLKVVLADGASTEFGCEPLVENGSDDEDDRRRIAIEVGDVLRKCAHLIDQEQPAELLKTGGYRLRGVLRDDSVDLVKLLVGSEGTLAVFAEAVLATSPVPPHRGLLLASFRTLESALHAVLDCREFQPTACELIDRRLVSQVRETNRLYRMWIPADVEGLLLIEQEGSTEENVRRRLGLMADRMRGVKQILGAPVEVVREPELSLCWQMRHGASSRLAKSSGHLSPVAFIENTAVPPDNLPRFLKRVQNIMKRHGVAASFSAHVGVGILHTRPLVDMRSPDHMSKLESIASETLEAVLECGGANNGEHGAGLLRSGLLPREFPNLYPVFGKIKAIFDPHNQLNPGKIVGADHGFPIPYLRTATIPNEGRRDFEPQLLWRERSLAETAEQCNGCARCRTTEPSRRMCPIFKVQESELASPRAKANLMRQVVSGQLDPSAVSSDEFRAVADLCVNCKMCRVECPSSVDISTLMIDAKAANVAEHGLSQTDWFFARHEEWSKWASSNALLVNALLASPAVRWLMEKWFGLAQRRQVPRFHHRTFLKRAARNGWTRKPRASERRPKVAFFAGAFVNYQNPHLGECAVRVLEHQGLKVYVPPNQRASGMAPLAHGDLEAARSALDWNLNILAELARDGYDVVGPEPSAVLLFRDDAKNLIADPDLELLSERTYEFSEYLGILAARGQLRGGLRPIPLNVGYHEPCHQRALGPRSALSSLIWRIPELRMTSIDLGCSGMAGAYGMRHDGFGDSLRAGAAMLERLARDDLHFGMTQCGPCRIQMEQGAGKRTLHPAEWFAIAYGLVQRPEKLLTAPGKGLVSR